MGNPKSRSRNFGIRVPLEVYARAERNIPRLKRRFADNGVPSAAVSMADFIRTAMERLSTELEAKR